MEKLVLEILNNGRSPSDINKTFICLISKCKNPKTLKEFFPISPCNMIMKIVSKMITNRLKPILPDLVDEGQSAFVKN